MRLSTEPEMITEAATAVQELEHTLEAPRPYARAGLWLLAGLASFGLGAASAMAPVVLFGTLSGLILVAALWWFTVHQPAVIAVIVVVGFTLQPAGKLMLSPLLGPAKDVVVLVTLAVTLVVMAIRPIRHDQNRWISVVALLLMAVYVINPAGDHGAGWANATRLTVSAIGLLLIGYHNLDAARTWRTASSAIIWVAVVQTFVGVAQQLMGTRRLVEQFGYAFGAQVRETARGQLRSFGTLDEPFTYAALLLVALVIATQAEPRARRNAWLVPLLVVGVLISVNRTGLVVLVVVGAMWLYRLRRRSAPALVLLGLALAGLGLGITTTLATSQASGTNSDFLLTLNGRTQTWTRVIREPLDLLAGRGAGEIGSGLARSEAGFISGSPEYQPGRAPTAANNENLTSIDNSYLAVLADVGLPGLLIVLCLGGMALVRTRVWRLDNSTGWCVLGILTVIAMDGLTRSSLTAFPFGYIALYLVGVGLAEVDRVASNPAVAPNPVEPAPVNA
jgi:O-antigen ligase